MPSPAERQDLRDRQRLDVLARVAAGATIRDACAQPGAPSAKTVDKWRRADAAFGEALRIARAQGDHAARLVFDPAVAAVVLGRLRGGASMRAVERDPAMPSRRTLQRWMMTDLAFGEAVRDAAQARRRGLAERLGEVRRGRVVAWDAGLAERVLYLVGQGATIGGLRAADPAMPSARTVRGWRRARPDFDFDLGVNVAAGRVARGRARRRAWLEPLCAAIVEGASLSDLGAVEGLPHRGTLYAWVARDRVFAEAVARACAHRGDWYRDRMVQELDRMGVLGVSAARALLKPLSRRMGDLSRAPGRRWRG